MDTTLPTELTLAAARHEADQARVVKSEGEGAHAHSLAVIQRHIDAFVVGLTTRLSISDTRYHGDRELLAVIRTELDPAVVALAILQNTLNEYILKRDYRQACLAIGAAINAEVWAAGIKRVTQLRKTREGTEFVANLGADIERFVRKRHGNTKYRWRSARALAKRQGYTGLEWDEAQKLRVGHWGLTCLLELLPDVFELFLGPRQMRYVVLTAEANAQASAWVDAMIAAKPVWLPRREPPDAWTGLHRGGVADPRLANTSCLVRARDAKSTRLSAVSSALAANTMTTVTQGLNTLQAVPWEINKRVLGVMHECSRRGLQIKGLPNSAQDMPVVDGEWEALSDIEKKRYVRQREKTKRANRQFDADRTRFEHDLQTADAISDDVFYTAMNIDWRARVYGLPSFNYQRDEHIRSLFLFHDGEPINDIGMYWLKAHVAGEGAFEGVHKKPFSERVQWTDDNMEMIRSTAMVPLSDHRWHEAKHPWLFLAATQELVSCVESGSSRTSRLPVAYDASASGLQHLCAMTRADEGALVNLTPSPEPRDVYQEVAERVIAKLKWDTAHSGPDSPLADIWLAYLASPGAESPRDICKRNVMTYAYSSKVYGMAEQQREDLMAPLTLDVILGKATAHPFGPDDGYSAAKYIAKLVYRSIEEVVERPALAMTFLQRLAKALAHEGKPLRWTTPAGLPWINAYHVPTTRRINLWLADKGARVRYDLKLTTGEKREIHKSKVAQAVAPNVVHALDASHLLRTVVAASNAGIRQLATVHDSFGCLPNHAGNYRRIIREEFVRMYEEHDPLGDIYQQALADIDDKTRVLDIPTVAPGNSDISEVMKSDFAFA